MKLDIDLSELHLSAAKMKGLNSYLSEIRKVNKKYDEGLSLAIAYVEDNKGYIEILTEGQTKLILGDEEAICFKPFADIDLFYYES